MYQGSIAARPRSAAALFLAACLVLLSACTITLVSPYDEVIDAGVTRLHKSTTVFLLDMKQKAGTDAGRFEANTDFYIEALAEVASLQLRAANTPQNQITSDQLKLLADNYVALMNAHRDQEELGLNEDIYMPIKLTMDGQFGAILKFEIAKKRGAE